MSKFIKDVQDLVIFLAGKNIATKQPPEKVDLVLYEVSISLFNQYYDHYVKTQKIARDLDPFIKKATITLTNGVGSLPGDFRFCRYIAPVAENGNNAEVIEAPFWTNRKNRRLGGPSLIRPIARIEDTGVVGEHELILELNVGTDTAPAIVEIFYFKNVNKPRYAYTLSGSRYVYDDSASVDLEWNETLFPEIKLKALNALGINLREQQVTQYTEMMKREEGNK